MGAHMDFISGIVSVFHISVLETLEDKDRDSSVVWFYDPAVCCETRSSLENY
jgi:hypothetical protein